MQTEETGLLHLLQRRKTFKMFLLIFSLFLSSDFVHSDKSYNYNFTSFCICPSYAMDHESFCGHEISTSQDCMTHAVYKCINGPNKITRVLKYCSNSRCAQVGVGNTDRFNSNCLGLNIGQQFFKGNWKSKQQFIECIHLRSITRYFRYRIQKDS